MSTAKNNIPGMKNVTHQALVNKTKIHSLPFPIKHEYIKQFVKAMHKDKERFKYLIHLFPCMGQVKIKECIFRRAKIKQRFHYSVFKIKLNAFDKIAWDVLKM